MVRPGAVVFLLNSFGLGGSERKIVKLAPRLANAGFTVGCAYMQKPDTLVSGLPSSVPTWFLDRRSRLSPGVLRRLRDIAELQGGATLVAVNELPTLYAAMAQRLWPRLVTRSVSLMNTSAGDRQRDRWFRPLYRRALGGMDQAVYGSEGQRQLWDRVRSPAWARSRVIYNGVDTTCFDLESQRASGQQLRRELGVPAGRFLFGSSGRLAPEKNFGVLVAALRQLVQQGVDAGLLIVGEGPMRASLEAAAVQAGVRDRLLLPGQREDVRPALAALDVFVMPSHHETFSNASLEAMAMSRPVMLSRVGGAAEMVNSGVEGFLLSPEKLESQLCEGLLRFASDSTMRETLGCAARMRVMSQFSDDAMLHSYLDVLHA